MDREGGQCGRFPRQLTVLLPISVRVLGPGHYDTLGHRANLVYWTELQSASPDDLALYQNYLRQHREFPGK